MVSVPKVFGIFGFNPHFTIQDLAQFQSPQLPILVG
jgi:hypothetical protein